MFQWQNQPIDLHCKLSDCFLYRKTLFLNEFTKFKKFWRKLAKVTPYQF